MDTSSRVCMCYCVNSSTEILHTAVLIAMVLNILLSYYQKGEYNSKNDTCQAVVVTMRLTINNEPFQCAYPPPTSQMINL